MKLHGSDDRGRIIVNVYKEHLLTHTHTYIYIQRTYWEGCNCGIIGR